MDPKTFFKNKSLCTLPWSGFELEPNGRVKNCVVSKDELGNINQTGIKDIIGGTKNINLKKSMLRDQMPANCGECHAQEKNRSDVMSISSRLYYHRELAKKIDMDFYDDENNFKLKHVDLRWTNSCNQACVYCHPRFSSKWAKEMGVTMKSNVDAKQEVKDFVFENIKDLENVYLAGGEPMLMKENLEFLKLLKQHNPDCSIRVNTNLSTTSTGIFDLLCTFPNVHWTVSLETIEREYEYIRHFGSWKDFTTNLDTIQKLDHRISFNMLHFILNHKSLFGCVDYLKGIGFHDNSFVIGPMHTPPHLHLLNLPDTMVENVLKTLQQRIDKGAEGYLKNSYDNLLKHFSTTAWKKDIANFVKETEERDKRRGTDCRSVFPELFEELDV